MNTDTQTHEDFLRDTFFIISVCQIHFTLLVCIETGKELLINWNMVCKVALVLPAENTIVVTV